MSDNQKIVLTLLSQQYGLTVEDLMKRFGCKREDIIVEQYSKEAKQEK